MTKERHNAIMKRSKCRNKFLKDKVKQAAKITKFSETYVRNYWGKPKNRTLKALTQKKSRIIEPSDKLLFLFSQKKASKGEKIILNEVEKHISDDIKTRTVFNNFFSNDV